ncbi:MAG: hypothetical protein J6V00_07770 [Bacteroidaceae bacterium]|nr:hypothetical protein [Bacteroidaceae bacterium]
MKMYTNSKQTAKLIELGFEPSTRVPFEVANDELGYTYSIGELIEMLPENVSQRIRYVATKRAWVVDADVLGKDGRCYRGCYHRELIEALYVTIIKLKEEGVI